LSTAIPTIGPIPRKGHRRLCRHKRRPIRRPGRTMAAMALGDMYKEEGEICSSTYRSSTPQAGLGWRQIAGDERHRSRTALRACLYLALSRRKHGSSPLGSANDFKYLSRHDASIHPSLGSFWGISDREQGRPTADIRGNLGGPRCGTRVEGLADRPRDPIDVRPRTPRRVSTLLVGGLSDMMQLPMASWS
jgi:hypothetical protein